MVCAKCEKKLSKSSTSTLACTDVWRSAGPSGDRNERKVGENKLLSAKARFSPYAPVKKEGGELGKGKAKGREEGTIGRCESCKSTVQRAGAKYCQGCAYKAGICAMCAKKVLDTSQYKMSSK
ncbi:hypothetical protein T439DRAFT_323149 [Meredithblackwellia eburnea MCA 4105]